MLLFLHFSEVGERIIALHPVDATGVQLFWLAVDWYASLIALLVDGRMASRSQDTRSSDMGMFRTALIVQSKPVPTISMLEARKALTTAQKCRLWLQQLFRFAMVKTPGLEQNPTLDLEVVAQSKPPVIHNPFLRTEDLPLLLRSLRGYRGSRQTRMGLQLLLLTGVRTGELRFATPSQFDLGRGLWIIPPEVVKQLQLMMRKQGKRPQDVPPYTVPLSKLLSAVRPDQHYLLARRGDVTKPISENTLNLALKSLGFHGQLTGHGIRATITTALNELGYPKAWIDAQLSHVDTQGGGVAYNHAEYVEPRRRMMQDWADRLTQMEEGSTGSAKTPMAEQVNEPSDPGSVPKVSVIHLEGGALVTVTISLSSSRGDRAATAQPLPRSLPCELDRSRQEAYDAPNNLPLPAFAQLAGKPCEQILERVKVKRLLSLFLEPLGHRIPDWQLDSTKFLLTLYVLTHLDKLDAWEIYRALSTPSARLEACSPVEMVTPATIIEIGDIVCAMLSDHWA